MTQVDNMKEVERLKCLNQRVRKLKVAAYARVSTESDRLRHSLAEQISRYSSLIRNTPQWTFAGIYSDEGISGTGMAKRTGFLKMLQDCENGLIDIILTKSIQRFARNTVDLLKTVRHLKDIGVEVRFERENISTFSKEGELMLSILASFAQDEARSISENVKWAIHKRFENGIPQCRFNVYGYRWRNDTLVPVPAEAETVRMIFGLYLNGMTMAQVAGNLNSSGKRTRNHRSWNEDGVRRILANRIYAGDLLLQKQYRPDSFPKRSVNNKGEMPMFLVRNSHDPIVDLSTWEAAQTEKERRHALGASCHPTTFSGKIRCGQCGCNYHRKLKRDSSVPYWFWTCRGKEENRNCSSVDFKESVIEAACACVLKTDGFDKDVFRDSVRRITVQAEDLLAFSFQDGTEAPLHWNLKNRRRRLDSSFPTMLCGTCGALYRRRNYTLTSGEKVSKFYCSEGRGHEAITEEDLRDLLKDRDLSAVESMTIDSETLVLNIRDGRRETIQRRDVRCRNR